MRALLLVLTGVALAVGAGAQTALPRVLVLGDTTQRPALDAARKALADRVELVFPKDVHANDTGEALAHLDALLGEGEWDLVYFGYGLGDLVYRDPRTEDRRTLARGAGGVRTTSDERYRENLVQLVARLEGTGAPLLWANTTPTERLVIGNSPVDNLFDAGAELTLNAIAAEVMDVHDVPVVDLHAFCMAQFEAGKHPGFLDYAKALSRRKEGPRLHEPIVEAILARLGGEEASEAEERDGRPGDPEGAKREPGRGGPSGRSESDADALEVDQEVRPHEGHAHVPFGERANRLVFNGELLPLAVLELEGHEGLRGVFAVPRPDTEDGGGDPAPGRGLEAS